MEAVIQEILKALGWGGAVIVAIASYLVKKEVAFLKERQEFNAERKEWNAQLLGLIEKETEHRLLLRQEIAELKLHFQQMADNFESLATVLARRDG